MQPFSRREFLKRAVLGTAALAVPGLALAQPTGRKPNVVFILADDLGWMDLACQGSTFYETPNIDALAARGMRFTQAYAANPLCSPTRASILTGLYPARIGMTLPAASSPAAILDKALDPKASPDHKALTARCVTRIDHHYATFAELFKAAGYATAHIGKWHAGRPPYEPAHQGFDIDIPRSDAPEPQGGFLAPWRVWPGEGKPGEHLEDRMAAEAAHFIREHKDQPFLLHYWMWSVHNPFQTKPELIEKFKAKADPAHPQRNPVYAGMIRCMDDAVGTVVKALNEAGLADNTIVVFFSDNGGFCWTSSAEGKGAAMQGYADVPVTSNAPLRGGKGNLYEGGTREPLIVAWPGRIAAGAVDERSFVQSIDFLPTLAELCAVPLPPEARFDGISFAPALAGKALAPRPIFCHFPHYMQLGATPEPTLGIPGTSVRQGDWKLIRFYCDGPEQSDRYELFNLKEDPGERHDLAVQNVTKVSELSTLIDRHLKEIVAVVPVRNPAYDPAVPPGATRAEDGESSDPDEHQPGSARQRRPGRPSRKNS